MLGFTSEARFIRYAQAHLRPWFPYLPDRAGYNKRLRRAGHMMQHIIAAPGPSLSVLERRPLARGLHPGRVWPFSRETVKRSDLAGWADLRVLRVTLSVLLGATTAPHRHPFRTARSHSRSLAPRPTSATPPST